MNKFKGIQKTYIGELFKLAETKEEVTKQCSQKQEEAIKKAFEFCAQVCKNILHLFIQ